MGRNTTDVNHDAERRGHANARRARRQAIVDLTDEATDLRGTGRYVDGLKAARCDEARARLELAEAHDQ